MAEALLEAEGLAKTFGRRVVLRSASFVARRGSVTALMGRNGAGKSTLMRLAVGRVRADRGRVLFKGRVWPRPSLASMAPEGIYYCAEESLPSGLGSVGALLDAVGSVFGRSDSIAQVVDGLRIADLCGRKQASLSGGERQRAQMAMALIRQPECLLTDEPLRGMEPKDRALVRAALMGLRDRGCAIVLTGHDVEDVFDVADEIIWIVDGESRSLGSPAHAAEDGEFRHRYLGRRSLP